MSDESSPVDRIDYFSLSRDPIPEAVYLGSTRDGVRYRVPPLTQTMIEDAGPPSTFVQDRLSDMIEPEFPPNVSIREGDQPK